MMTVTTDKYIALLEQIIKSSDNDKRIHYISTDNFNLQYND